jgi:hypothetical protein
MNSQNSEELSLRFGLNETIDITSSNVGCGFPLQKFDKVHEAFLNITVSRFV